MVWHAICTGAMRGAPIARVPIESGMWKFMGPQSSTAWTVRAIFGSRFHGLVSFLLETERRRSKDSL